MNARRAPIQDRAKQTIQTLFQAASQILQKDGEQGLTTNKIADQAGFSVGTLYQYFPTKEKIIQAMAIAAAEQVVKQLDAYISGLESDPQIHNMDAREVLGKAIDILIEGFASHDGLKQPLTRLGWLNESHEDTYQIVNRVADRWALFFERINHPGLNTPTPAQMYVMTRSVIGTLRSASLEKTIFVKSPTFSQAIVAMVWAILAKK